MPPTREAQAGTLLGVHVEPGARLPAATGQMVNRAVRLDLVAGGTDDLNAERFEGVLDSGVTARTSTPFASPAASGCGR